MEFEAEETEIVDPNIVWRALEWQDHDLETLDHLVSDLTSRFDDTADHEKPRLRMACEALLIHDNLPDFYRAQVLVLLARSEAEDFDKMLERLHEARFWLMNGEVAMIRNSGLRDSRVRELRRTISSVLWTLYENEEG